MFSNVHLTAPLKFILSYRAILNSSFDNKSVFANVVGGGLPSEHRAYLWMLFTKKDLAMRKNLDLYKNLVGNPETFSEESAAVQQIEKVGQTVAAATTTTTTICARCMF